MQTATNNIKHLVELTLGRKIALNLEQEPLMLLDPVTDADPLEQIKYYLNNPHLVTKQTIAELVSKKLITQPEETILPVAERWNAYLHKLEHVLEQIKYRKAHNYEFHKIMPSQQLLRQLQSECWNLTTQWYGTGNLSCFYNYFIIMCNAAGITRFVYRDVAKFTSQDYAVTVINREERRQHFLAFNEYYADYVKQGGMQAYGRSVIDATDISNVFYYKQAQLYFYHEYAKKLLVATLDLEDYGQVPYMHRANLWRLLVEHYPFATHADQENLFYKFVEYINARPGEYFNYFAADLPEVGQVSAQTLHDIIKMVGLQTNYLCLFARDTVDNLIPKRHFSFSWRRKYPLQKIVAAKNIITLRAADQLEMVRILPNELPYGPGHGMSLCGTGLIEDPDYAGQSAYEWNSPVDPTSDIDNWARDVEKLFREFKIFCPNIAKREMLFGEKLCNSFHNTMAYSTIQTTQHTHIITAGYERYLLYQLPPVESYKLAHIQAGLDVVQVGDLEDSIFLRFEFADLDNEPLLKFLIDLNNAAFVHFDGEKNLDVHIHLFATAEGRYIFIFEPHVFLMQLDNDKFVNPFTNTITPRKPQFMHVEGENIHLFTNEMAEGLNFCKKFFESTARPGIREFISQFIRRFV